jgi:GTP:adenosylcobinamide-phosphate guanylyltransferase/predicted alpha/beta hydrolase family esterase
MINYAIVMCGGKARHFNGVNKSLVKHNEKTMLSYVLESISRTKIRKIIFLANESNYHEIEEEVRKCTTKDYIILNNPPARFREMILHVRDIIDNNPVLVVVGNQPMKEDFLEKMVDLNEKEGCLVATIYDKKLSNEPTLAGLTEEGFIQEGELHALQHPFILSKEVLENQIQEDFKYKVEETLKRMGNNKIKGILAEMPPEFDNEEMLKTTKDYLDMLNMESIFIPGNYISNKEWIERAKVELRTILPNSKIHYYEHWENWDENKPVLDFEREIERLKQEINQDKKIIIFAKSVGAVLALKMIKDKLIKPEKCIFLGFPVNWAIKNNFKINEWIKDYNTPTLFIQNKNDPLCTHNQLIKFLEENNNINNFKIVESEGDTHDYDDYDLIKESISSHLSSSNS